MARPDPTLALGPFSSRISSVRVGSLALFAAALLSLTACASSQQAPSAFDREGASEIRIEVDNRNFNDATVWAIEGNSTRTRLGVVGGKSQSVFTLPWRFSNELRLEFNLLAGDRCTSRTIPVDPGDSLELQIAAVFRETCR